MSGEPQIEGLDRPEPALVSVSYKPEALTVSEEWSFFFARVNPTSRRPVLRAIAGLCDVTVAASWLGILIGMAGSPTLNQTRMGGIFFALSLLLPLRIWVVKRRLIGTLRGLGPLTIELSEEGARLGSKHRVFPGRVGGSRRGDPWTP